MLNGLQVSNFKQKNTDCMDDIQFLSSSAEDLVTFNQIMLKFEAQSGAILSRDRKTKVMGLGRWRGKEYWPQEIKRPSNISVKILCHDVEKILAAKKMLLTPITLVP